MTDMPLYRKVVVQEATRKATLKHQSLFVFYQLIIQAFYIIIGIEGIYLRNHNQITLFIR